jgi:hypothetical protein
MEPNGMRRRPITTLTHGVLDYVLGVVLFFVPNLLGFADLDGPAVWVPRLIGALSILQAIVTRYELGLVKLMPMRFHLFNDFAAGVFLAVSPWLLRFYDSANERLWLPHVVAGVAIVIVTAMTQRHPRRLYAGDDGKRREAHA